MSENETRDGATICELGGTLSSREDKIQVLPVFSCFGFSRLFYILPPSFSTEPSPWHPMGNTVVEGSLGL